MTLSDEQRGVLGGMVSGLAVTVGALGAALAVPPMRALTLSPVFSRLDFWSGWVLPVLLTLLLAIGMLAHHRFFSAKDIDASLGTGSARARMLQAVLQNTLEQTVLWLVVTLIWSIRMPVPTLGVVPVSVILFVLGRALFLHGYAGGAGKRALGFALTFYPSVLMAALLVLERLGVPFG